MINLKQCLIEDRSNKTADAGCIMAMIPDNYCKILNKYNHMLIEDKDLFIKDNEFGREKECHVTVKYGLFPDLNELQMREILKGINPFMITLTGISKFQNKEEGFDVVKFDVQSEILNELNKRAGKYPCPENKFPDYHAHLTIAYVLPGKFPHEVKDLNIQIPIKQICYSPSKGSKSYYDL